MFLVVIVGDILARYQGRKLINMARVTNTLTVEELENFRLKGFG